MNSKFKKLFLTLPGGNVITDPQTKFNSLGGVLSETYQVVFYIATFTAFAWLVWGVFEYIFAGGDKNGIASARKRITWAIIGLIFVLLAFLIAQWGAQVVLPKDKVQQLPIF